MLSIPLRASFARPFLESTLQNIKNGNPKLAQEVYSELASGLSDGEISPEEHQKHVADLAHAQSSLVLSQDQMRKYRNSKPIVERHSAGVNQLHNHFFNTDPEYRALHQSAVLETTRRDMYTEFKSTPMIAYRGLQAHLGSDFAHPEFQFNNYSTTLLASAGQMHNGAGIIVPRINDPADATDIEVQTKTLCWTKGYTCNSLDLERTGRYAIKAFGENVTQGSVNGYIYAYMVPESISMDEHMHRELTDEETTSARYNYEIISTHSSPEFCVGAFPIDQDGKLHEFIPNPKADDLAKKAFETMLIQDDHLGTLHEGSLKKSNLFQLKLQEKANTPIEEFEKRLPSRAEHQQRFEERARANFREY